MLKQIILLSCATGLTLVYTAANVVPDNFANGKVWDDTITVDSDGKTFEIEQFDGVKKFENFQGLSKERYAFDERIINEVTKAVNELTRKVLIEKANGFFITAKLVSLGLRLKKIFNENAELKKRDTSPILNSGLGVNNADLLDNLMADPAEEIKTNEGGEKNKKDNKDDKDGQKSENEAVIVIDAVVAQKRIETVMNALKLIVKKSKTGAVLDWSKMKVDGEKLEDYLKPAIQKLVHGDGSSVQVRKLLKIASNKCRATKDDLVKGRGQREDDSAQDGEKDEQLF